MLDTIKFFSRYNNNMIIDYRIIEEFSKFGKEIINGIIKVLEKIEKEYSKEDIYFYYFREFYEIRKENGYTYYFDITKFLDEISEEYSNFYCNGINEMELYNEITHYLN